MRFIDFFAGIGGFRKGMELAGHECVGFCEFDKFAVMSYTSMHLITEEQRAYLATLDLKARQKEILKEEYRNGEWYADDIRRVHADDIPDSECWCFGFPCQDISVAGNQLGFTGNRSSLFFRVMYLLGQLPEEKKPAYLFIENVKNLLSVNGGWDFARLLIEMDRGGYDAEWQVLNSEFFGVPQQRERLFIIGCLRGRSSRGILPTSQNNTETDRPKHKSLQKGIICGYGHEPKLTNKSSTIGAYQGKGTSNQQMTFVCVPCITPNRVKKRQHGRRFKENGEPMFTLTAQDRHGVAIRCMRTIRSEFDKKIRKDYESGKTKISRHAFLKYDLRPDNITNTLTTVQKDNLIAKAVLAGQHPCVWWDKYKTFVSIRRLTPKEYFRLQGWTDDYFERAEFVNSNSQLYKQAGNGVTVNVIQAIAEKMKKE